MCELEGRLEGTYSLDGFGLVVHGSDRRGNEAAVLQLLPLLKSDTGGRTNGGEGEGDGGWQ